MIEIHAGSLEEQILKIVQKTYPITVADLQNRLKVGKTILLRTLKKLQTRGILRLEPLPNKTYIRLLRNDFTIRGGKHQRKTMKHKQKEQKTQLNDSDGLMYS
jgi:predicted ArsR family transcriptional regulator